MRKFLAGYLVFFSIILVAILGDKLQLIHTDDDYKYQTEVGTRYVAKIEGKQFSLYDGEGQWRDFFITGVNLGSGKPGYFPGEFGITKKDYLRWFQSISDMNVNTIRVYVLQMPEFYQAFQEFNATAEKPLYMMHGVYMNEADIAKYQDAYAEDKLIYNTFMQDIKNVVDAVHGNAQVAPLAGQASGTYYADISRYVIGWILGIEWELEFVDTTNKNNPQYTRYDGEYVYTEEVTPFEVMLAEGADTAISYEMQNYHEQRPLAMSNWVTSDPLHHPGEPNPEVEDAISIDMENLKGKSGFEAGFFASYHVYPYYPDVFNYDQELLQDDPPNSYKAYIRMINNHHSMPVMISELGIPASRGIAHKNIHSGFNQGHVTEEQQGQFLVSMLGDIYSEGLMGAAIFSWQDEWFKKTWNTQDIDIASRRSLWMDYQTNEQSFGILSFDPGENQSVSYVDGDISEWGETDVVLNENGRRISMKSDEKFVYIMAETDAFEKEPLYLPIDIASRQGNTHYGDVPLGMAADYVLVLDGKENSTLLIDPYYDSTYYQNAIRGTVIPRDAAYERPNTNRFVPINLLLNRGIYVVDTGERLPYDVFDTGKLRYGIANPEYAGYDSIADFYAGDGFVEIRLPWLLLNINDPSSKQVIGNLYEYGGVAPETIESIGIGIVAPNNPQDTPTARYRWDGWEMPKYHERLKKSYPIIQSFYGNIEAAARTARTKTEIFWERVNQKQFANIGAWFPIQPVLNYCLAFLLSVILYFFMVLIYVHASSAVKTASQQVLERHILAAISQEVPEEHSAQTWKKSFGSLHSPFSRSSLLIFNKLMEQFSPEEKERIRIMMLDMGYEDYVTKHLQTRNIGYLILLVRMIGELRLNNLAKSVKDLLYKHKDDTDLQYQGLLTLSAMGAQDQLAAITMDENFVQTLSFRSLQEIAKAYQGDKEQLYAILLDAPDLFIRRIAIKRIGAEQLTDLAAEIIPHLDSDNYNVIVDAVRCLGQLEYADAAPKIASLLSHPRWEVRAVAVTAIAAIDMTRYEVPLIQALSDSDWTVRNNAAAALSKAPHAEEILALVEQSNDKYAYEVLKYLMDTHNLWGAQT